MHLVLKSLLIWELFLLSCTTSAWAARTSGTPSGAVPGTIELRVDTTMSSEPLTTDKVWDLDPEERNPHRARWVLERQMAPMEFRVSSELDAKPGSKVTKEKFKVSLSAVEAHTLMWVRAQNSTLFRELNEFNCATEPESTFANAAGARIAVTKAAELWRSSLVAALPKLELQLARLRAGSADEALRLGQMVFDFWRDEVASDWRATAKREARKTEWASYLTEARQFQICPRSSKSTASTAVTWTELVGAPPAEPQLKVIARAPAKRVAGLYTLRLSVAFGDKTLNGRFLVDTGAESSLVSPQWLLAQGINPALVTVSGLAPTRVRWSGGSGWGKHAIAFETRLADLELPLKEFLLTNTQIFNPPEVASACCDGVLGADFLRNFAVEFEEGPPPSIVLYQRRGFSHGASVPWIEVGTLPSGFAVSSSCELVDPKGDSVSGVQWNSGERAAVEVHSPWLAKVRSSREGWTLQCHGEKLTDRIPLSFPDGVTLGAEDPLAQKTPGVTVGMELLGRGNFTIDLSNGRLWYRKANLERGFLQNKSGLELTFIYGAEARRLLRVARLREGSPAALQLASLGLKVGSEITDINGLAAAELDRWEVERKLSGSDGPKLSLKWKTGKRDLSGELILHEVGTQSAPIQ